MNETATNPLGIHCVACSTAAPCDSCAEQIAAEHAYAKARELRERTARRIAFLDSLRGR